MAETVEIRAKYGGIEKLPDTDQGPNYRVSFYPSYGRTGYSTYPSLKMFINGCEEQSRDAIVKLLETIEAKTALTLQVDPGGVRPSKKDDGKFDSYFWNIGRLLTVGGAPVKVEAPANQAPTPPAEGSIPPESESLQEENEATQRAAFDSLGTPSDEPPPGQQPQAEEPPAPEVGETPTREQAAAIEKVQDKVAASILASWAVNQARETYEYLFDAPQESEMDGMFNDIHRLSLRYIRMKQHLDRIIQGGTK